jgi:hypothetical protein
MSFCTNSGTFYPLYLPRSIVTTIPGSTLSSAQTFVSPRGYVGFTITDATTGYTFSFTAAGGYDSPNLLPTANSILFINGGSEVGCTVTPLTYIPGSYANFLLTTPAGDSGGRTYEIVFYSYATIKPTIRLTTGTAVATNLVVKASDAVFARGMGV